MKKILFILHLPPPVHGASIMGDHIKRSYRLKTQYETLFINLSASKNVDEVGKLSLRKILFLLSNIIEVLLTVIREKPDLCYLTPTSDGWGFYRDYVMTQLLKLLRVRIVLHFHNKASSKWLNNKINSRLTKYFLSNVKIVLLDELLYDEKKAYITKNNVYYCPNGMPSIALSQNMKQSNNKTATSFLFLSNMMKEKGVFVLLDACKILRDEGYDFNCNFVGNWKDIKEKDVYNFIAFHNLEKNIFVHGPKYNLEKVKYFNTADVFVFPTFYHGETFGLVLLEAMDFSLPCISTKNGAISSIIQEGITGFCIEPDNSVELANRMIWMINHPDERVLMGVKGKERFATHYTLDHFEDNLIRILEDCLR